MARFNHIDAILCKNLKYTKLNNIIYPCTHLFVKECSREFLIEISCKNFPNFPNLQKIGVYEYHKNWPTEYNIYIEDVCFYNNLQLIKYDNIKQFEFTPITQNIFAGFK